MKSKSYVTLIKDQSCCTGVVKKLKGSKWVSRYVELHDLVLALYKSQEELRNPNSPNLPEVVHFGVYNCLSERPDTKGQKYCIALTSSKDTLLEQLVLAVNTESELRHWRKVIMEQIQKAQGPMPKPGHLFGTALVSLKGKCDFCSQSLKKGFYCAVCEMKIHRDCKVHCNFLCGCVERLTQFPLKSAGDKEITRQKISLIFGDISKSDVVDIFRIKLFEYFVKNIHECWPLPPLTVGMKEYPRQELYSYDCFSGKYVTAAHHCYTKEDLVVDFLIRRIIGSGPLIEKECSAQILAQISKNESVVNQVIFGNHVPCLVKELEGIMSITNVSYLLASSIMEVIKNVFLSSHPQLNRLRDEVLSSLLQSLVRAQEIKYAEQKKKGEQLKTKNRIWMAQCRTIVASGAPILYNAYKESPRWCSEISDKKGLAVIVTATEQGDFSLHTQIDENDLYDIATEPAYTGVNVKILTAKYKGMKVAVKQFSLAPEWFRREVTLQSLVDDHPLTCRFIGANESAGFIVTEWAERGSLDDVLLKSASEKAQRLEAESKPWKRDALKNLPSMPVIDNTLVINMMMQACNGIAFLHSKGIMHRDIKPGNFLCDAHYNTVVCDFGASRVAPSDIESRTTCIGTTQYIAPELLSDSEERFEMRADTYSMSLVIWQMLTNTPPYKGLEMYLFQYIPAPKNHRETYFPSWTHPDLKALIISMWAPEPRSRPSFTEVLNSLYEIKDEKGNRYCNRWSLLSSSLWVSQVGSYLDTKHKKALAVTCKHLKDIFDNTKKTKKKSKHTKNTTNTKNTKNTKNSKHTKKSKKNTTKKSPAPQIHVPTKISVGNTFSRIDTDIVKWKLFITADGCIESVISSVEYTLDSTFKQNHIKLSSPPFELEQVSYQVPASVEVKICFTPAGSTTITQHVQFWQPTQHNDYSLPNLPEKFVLTFAKPLPSGLLKPKHTDDRDKPKSSLS
eukprot:TRINITY_DN6004_c0_g1_i1.p1 TRINITY_DN6004_c0_g1~~TRINITY_DN6004_c0_g1_i1.p1  ORF type:complete len:960 (+),score=120.55 TRINITY_DN6004_c0_g1_i1:78-2957(+)